MVSGKSRTTSDFRNNLFISIQSWQIQNIKEMIERIGIHRRVKIWIRSNSTLVAYAIPWLCSSASTKRPECSHQKYGGRLRFMIRNLVTDNNSLLWTYKHVMVTIIQHSYFEAMPLNVTVNGKDQTAVHMILTPPRMTTDRKTTIEKLDCPNKVVLALRVWPLKIQIPQEGHQKNQSFLLLVCIWAQYQEATLK